MGRKGNCERWRILLYSKKSVIEHLPMYFDKIDTVYRIIKVLHEKGLVEYVKKKKRDYVRLTKKRAGMGSN